MPKVSWRPSSRIKVEIMLILGFNALMFVLFSQLDLLEKLVLFSQDHEDWELDEIIPLFFTLAISMAVFSFRRWNEMSALYEQVHQLSIKDPLTGLYNRRHAVSAIEQEIERSKRSGAELALIIIDIDGFKKINDSWGHNVGDRVLCQFSDLLSDMTRKVDMVARWGGEEFIILCPDIDLEGAGNITNKLITAIRQTEFDRVGKVTASIGAVSAATGEETESVVHRADICLYKGKRGGRDCVVLGS